MNVEHQVLGCILRANKSYGPAREIVTGDDFENPTLGAIFDAIGRHLAAGGRVDAYTLENYFPAWEIRNVGADEPWRWIDAGEYPEAVTEAAMVVRAGALRRRGRDALTTALEDLRDTGREPSQVLQQAAETLTAALTPADKSEDADGSWAPLDVAEIVAGLAAGELQSSVPEIFRRDDGSALFYAGKVNGVHGESGSGKSWTALFAAAQVLAADGVVIYVDMEDSPADLLARLLALGVAPHVITERFRYVQPATVFQSGSRPFLRMAASASLVVIDSTGESLSIEGANPNADEDIAAWFRNVPKCIAKRGPAVLVLDHMPKSSESDLWPIGSQRKRAAIDGAQYLQEVMVPFSRERAGAARLVCAKDRHGTYARAQRVAELHVTPNEGAVDLTLKAPLASSDASAGFQPTAYMEKVSAELSGAAGPLTYRGILERVGGKKEYVRRAVDELIRAGYLSIKRGPRNSMEHTLVKPFYAGEHSAPETARTGSVTVPVPKEGERGTVKLTVPREQWGTVGEQSKVGGIS
ncbi:AAA family ATPase [Microbacterium sp. H83]|uniref:AAA family ATPase n=1 Tax=Microbacterium sp. H83 TaxID=1827324 RepID=UPI0007F4B7AA|nr:AAA family ATPase [Microbacterium sp. H83]OAN37441.1 hypothetical protein A4X16_16660 [Microbacterium sp. H83]